MAKCEPIKIIDTGRDGGGRTTYNMTINDKKWSEIYYNMRGYVADFGIPAPHKDEESKDYRLVGFQIGEKPIRLYQKEVRKINRELCELFPDGKYPKIRDYMG